MRTLSEIRISSVGGFTLMEVMISIVILAFISMGIYQATTRSYEIHDKILAASDFNSEVRLAMGVLERDVGMLYSPIIMAPTKPPSTTSGSQGNSAQLNEEALGRSNAWWGAPLDKTGLRPSRFIGTESKITFIAASNIRLYREAPESIFSKITYELVDDPTSDRSDSRKMLLKASSPNAFDEDDNRDKFQKKYPLLHGIKKWNFSYYRANKNSWTTSWDSDTSDLKNNYPDIIKVTLEVSGTKRQFFEGLYQFKTEIPFRDIPPTL